MKGPTGASCRNGRICDRQQRAARDQPGQRLDVGGRRPVVHQGGRVLADLGVGARRALPRPRGAVRSQVDRLGRGQQLEGQDVPDVVQDLQRVVRRVGARAVVQWR